MELFNESPFNKLPIEIIYIILSYTYQPQSKELTEDIKNYYESKSKFYEERLVEYLCFHSAKYQNYILNTNEDIQPDHTVKSNQGIVFDNDDYCEFNKIKYI